jgi:low affinity Fe/Cu permease
MSDFFNRFARVSAIALGSHWSFIWATALCVAWALSGPLFDYSDTWQLVINTATTVLTFLAVFLIQNTQNRDTLALQLKVDELLRAVEAARTRLVGLENCTDEEIEYLRKEFDRIARRAKNAPSDVRHAPTS